MASDAPNPNDLVIWKAALSIDRASSRLIKRGLAALDEAHTVCLEVRRLIALGSSVFIFDEHWDPYWTDLSNKTETWKEKRQVVCFEFHRSGRFLQKLILQLVTLTDDGYSRVPRRLAGRVMIRPTFIHYYEELVTEEPSIYVRVDYLFSRSGQRQAVWSDSLFVNRYRKPGEPRVASVIGMNPAWLTGTSLVAGFYPHQDESFEYSDGTYEPLIGSTFKHVALWIDVEAFSAAVNDAELVDFEPYFGSDHRTIVTFPAESVLYDTEYHRSWDVDTAGTSALWFLKERGFGETTLVWKLEISGTGPQVAAYSLPHPYDLARQGIISVAEDNGDIWIPSEADYRSLESGYYSRRASFSTYGNTPEGGFYNFECQTLLSSGDDLIVTMSVEDLKRVSYVYLGAEIHYHDEILVLFRRESGALRAVKQVDPDTFRLSAFNKRRDALKDPSPEFWDPYFEHPSRGLSNHQSFADDRLYSISYSRNYKNSIVVTNVHTEEVTWFRPEVPVGELKTHS